MAIVTRCSALVLVAIVAARLAEPTSPVTLSMGGPRVAVGDLAAFIGFVAVFSLRAPDFSVGLATRRHLAWCITSLVIPATLLMLAGVGMRQGTRSADLVGTLAGSGLALSNLLVAVAVIAPAFTTTYSGSLALRGFTRLSSRAARHRHGQTTQVWNRANLVMEPRGGFLPLGMTYETTRPNK